MSDLSQIPTDQLLQLYQQPEPANGPLSSMSTEDLLQLYQQGGESRLESKREMGRSDVAADVAKSGGIGVVRGGIGILGLPGDIGSLVGAGVSAGADKLGINPEKTQHFKDIVRGAAKLSPLFSPFTQPGSSEITRQVEGLTGEFYRPKTMAGEYAQTIGEFVPAAASGPGGIARRVATQVVLPALASETAGQLTKGTAYEPYARAGAAIGTGVGASLLTRPSYSERLVGNAARGANEGHYAAAEQLMRDAQVRGIRLTPAEAIQHVTDGTTRLGDVQRLAESTTEGGARLAPMFAERPAQMQAAVNRALDQISVRGATPSYVGREAQEAATGALERTRRNINHLAEPFYQAAESVPIPSNEMAQLRNMPGYPAAMEAIRSTPQLNRYVSHLPDDSVGFLNEVKKQLNQSSQNVAAATNPNRNVQVAAGYARDAANVTDMGRTLSPDYGRALAVEEAGRRRVLGPLQSGPVGAMSLTDDIVQQGRALINNVNSPQEVTRALQNIGQQNQQAARGVVREELGRIADKTVGGLDAQARPDQFGGAKLARAIMGDARTSQNIDAAVEAVGGRQVSSDLRRLANVLQATGQRQRLGSLTAFNAEALADMKRGGVTGMIQSAVKPMAATKDIMQRMRLGSQSERLAELLMSGPDGVRRIQELAGRRGDMQAIFARALLAAQASQPAAR